LGLGYAISRQRDWKRMMDGDVSHLSELNCLPLGQMWAVGWFAFLFLFLCPFPFLFISLLCLQAFLSLIFLTSGASSPEWVKPTAEGGGLLVV
jgi:hypothetical protein